MIASSPVNSSVLVISHRDMRASLGGSVEEWCAMGQEHSGRRNSVGLYILSEQDSDGEAAASSSSWQRKTTPHHPGWPVMAEDGDDHCNKREK